MSVKTDEVRAKDSTSDVIEIEGLSATLGGSLVGGREEPHHVDVRMRCKGVRYRACIVAPDSTTFRTHVYGPDDEELDPDGGLALGGSLNDGIVHALQAVLYEHDEEQGSAGGTTQSGGTDGDN